MHLLEIMSVVAAIYVFLWAISVRLHSFFTAPAVPATQRRQSGRHRRP
jgi:hypothetical protein